MIILRSNLEAIWLPNVVPHTLIGIMLEIFLMQLDTSGDASWTALRTLVSHLLCLGFLFGSGPKAELVGSHWPYNHSLCKQFVNDVQLRSVRISQAYLLRRWSSCLL